MATLLNLLQVAVRFVAYCFLYQQGVSLWWLLLIEATCQVHWKFR